MSSIRLIEYLDRLTPGLGRHQTSWPGLTTFRAIQPTLPTPMLYVPALCVVAQGAKEAVLTDRVFRYDALNYLVIGAAMPVRARIVEAAEDRPFLSMVLEIDTGEVHDLLLEMHQESGSTARSSAEERLVSPLQVSPVDDALLGAIVRFLEALEKPMDQRILAPQILREIIYLTLRRDQGDLLRLVANRDIQAGGAARAMKYLRDHFDQQIDVSTLAREVGLSASSLHHTFKTATTLTPIQYLKQLRLHRARQLLVDQGVQSAEAAHRVGYASPSQFSREFKRLFGLPPRRYAETWADEMSA